MGSSVKDYKLPVQPNVMNNNHLTASVGEAFVGFYSSQAEEPL